MNLAGEDNSHFMNGTGQLTMDNGQVTSDNGQPGGMIKTKRY